MGRVWLYWLIAWGIVSAIIAVLCVIQESGARRSLQRLGYAAVGMAVLGGLFLFKTGIL